MQPQNVNKQIHLRLRQSPSFTLLTFEWIGRASSWFGLGLGMGLGFWSWFWFQSGHIFASTFPLMWPQMCGKCKTPHTNLIRKLSIKLAQCNALAPVSQNSLSSTNCSFFIYGKHIYIFKLVNSNRIGRSLNVSNPNCRPALFIWVMTGNCFQLV